MELPTKESFKDGTKFYIKEFDVPLHQDTDGKWFNWFGGKAKKYNCSGLKPGNNWEADSFDSWLNVIKDSL